jgi:hypothetical protein
VRIEELVNLEMEVKIPTLSQNARQGWGTLEVQLISRSIASGSASWFGDEFYLLQFRKVGQFVE